MPIFSSVLVVFFYVAICILGYLVCQIVSFVLVVFFYVAICILGYLVCPVFSSVFVVFFFLKKMVYRPDRYDLHTVVDYVKHQKSILASAA